MRASLEEGRNLQRKVRGFTRWAGALLMSALLIPASGISQQVTDGVAAVVGEDVILLSEVMQYGELQAYNVGVDPYAHPEAFRRILSDVLQRLIDQKIVLAEAERDSIRIQTYQVDLAMKQQIDTLIQQFGSREALEEAVHMSVAEIRHEFRETVRNRLLVQRYREQVLGMITVNREEVEAFYRTHRDSLPVRPRQVNISRIVINTPEVQDADSLAVEQLQEIQRLLREGRSFGELARLYSQDTTTSRQGGELGWLSQESLIPEFQKAFVTLQPGDVSDIIKTAFGYYLVQLEQREGHRVRARQILVKPTLPKPVVRAALDTLNRLRSQIMGGIPFDSLASQGNQPQDTENNLGWITASTVEDPVLQTVLDTLQVGEVSRPFRAPAGWGIIRLNGVRPAQPLTLDDDYQTIRDLALQAKRQQAYERLLRQLRAEYYVRINHDLIDQFLRSMPLPRVKN